MYSAGARKLNPNFQWWDYRNELEPMLNPCEISLNVGTYHFQQWI